MKLSSQTGHLLRGSLAGAQPRSPSAPPARGFSVLEVLIAVMIIGILAVILVPTLTHRAHEARIGACQEEMENIAEAESRAAILTGYFYRLYALDDIPGGDGLSSDDPASTRDGIGDEWLNTNLYDRPMEMFILPETNRFLSLSRAGVVYNTMRHETSYNWKGPFFNIQRDETPKEHDKTGFPRHMHDIPNDPWGNDYLLFLSDGLVLEPSVVIDSQGRVSYMATWGGRSYKTNIFDRPTILSLGPDGLPGDGSANTTFGQGDDLYRSFGHRGVVRY